MVEGRVRKFYEEAVLLEQVFVVDTEKRVKQVVEAAAKELGSPVEVAGFVRMALGEGIEKGGGATSPPRWRSSPSVLSAAVDGSRVPHHAGVAAA